ncbi:MAG TPA: endonuclease/exonuclease/phosphatase family protein [Kofleriaceae bacterium]|nr:endonuclease/exonuclease/phosphatase family protein [Kofleriaceae bacterium]
MSRAGRARAAAALVVGIAVAGGCAATPAVDGPVLRGSLPGAAESPPPRALTIVSYNVHLGDHPEAIAQAIRAGGLGDADVYLLQEIEDHVPAEAEPRAQALAAALGTAFVYAPARRLPAGEVGTHGLAVLSRWPITDDVVVRLPYRELLWRSRPRIALGVVLDVAGTPVQVWDVHLDTRIAVEDRLAQLAPVFERARALPGLAIIGGDLNTFSHVHARAVDQLAAGEGFTTPTAELSDSTAGSFWAWPPEPPMRLDAIYTRGFAIAGAGVDRAVVGSDHVPIWVQLAWPRTP